MAIILSLETATKVCSVALHNDGELVNIKEVNGDYSHSENLTVFTQEVMEASSVNFNDLDAIAVSKGPGSYTGLRIGVSSAKGLCYGLNIPLIAVETLQAMSFLAVEKQQHKKGIYLPMIDARRMEVFCAGYNKSGELIRPTSAEIVEESTFDDLTESNVYYFGDGAMKCQQTLSGRSNFIFLDGVYPSAETLGKIAFQKYQSSDFEDVAYFEPYYLKDFITTTPKKLL
jgi:tRNA threonylcarbamoyladenosine biosynthesis protein TsaB